MADVEDTFGTGAFPVRGDLYYDRLNRRLHYFIVALLIAFPILFAVLFFTQTLDSTVGEIDVAMYLVTLLFVLSRVEKDSIVTFITTHIFWMFPFNLLLYATVNWKSPSQDLYGPILSHSIAAVALGASIFAYFAARGVAFLINFAIRERPQAAPREAVFTGSVLILVAVPVALIQIVMRDNTAVNTLAYLFQSTLAIGLVFFVWGRGMRGFISPLLIIPLLVIVFIGIALNARGTILQAGVSMFLIYIGVSRRPFTVVRLVIMYFLGNFIGAVSTVMLYTRALAGHDGAWKFMGQIIFSQDFLMEVIGFGTLNRVAAQKSELERHDEYRLYMFDGKLGIFERLTELVHMDILVARLGWAPPLNVAEISNLFLATLPSLGQEKDIMLEDRLAWGTGLINEDTIGHPLVTAIGEFYSMGGFWILACLMALLIFTTLVWFFLSKRLIGNNFVASIGLLLFSMYMIFSSTSVSAYLVPLRIYPATLIMMLIVLAVARFFTVGGRRQAAVSRPAADIA